MYLRSKPAAASDGRLTLISVDPSNARHTGQMSSIHLSDLKGQPHINPVVSRVALPLNRNPRIVGNLPRVTQVKLFQAADVVELTGLSVNQLREWSSPRRRNLIPADVGPDGPGRHALYSWQSVLVLRLLRQLRDDFAVEIGVWAPRMGELRQDLKGVSFPSLWGRLLTFPSKTPPVLLSAQTREIPTGIVIALDPHLLPIATELSLPPPDQLFLFPVRAVA